MRRWHLTFVLSVLALAGIALSAVRWTTPTAPTTVRSVSVAVAPTAAIPELSAPVVQPAVRPAVPVVVLPPDPPKATYAGCGGQLYARAEEVPDCGMG